MTPTQAWFAPLRSARSTAACCSAACATLSHSTSRSAYRGFRFALLSRLVTGALFLNIMKMTWHRSNKRADCLLARAPQTPHVGVARPRLANGSNYSLWATWRARLDETGGSEREGAPNATSIREEMESALLALAPANTALTVQQPTFVTTVHVSVKCKGLDSSNPADIDCARCVVEAAAAVAASRLATPHGQ